MPTKKTEKEKAEKKPLDMTSDEAIEFLFGQEGAQVLKDHVRKLNGPPPNGDDNGSTGKSKSARKQDTT